MKKLLIILLGLFLLCGCTAQDEMSPLPTPTALPETQPIPTSVATPEPTPTPTPEPTPIPEPTPKPLEINAGASMSRFEDEETGDWLDYWLIAPENAVEGMPLLVFLHGDGNRAWPESLENNPLRSSIDEIYGGDAPFLTLMPNTRLYSWTAGSIAQTLLNLIESTAETYSADTDKIMICGHSRGAIGTWYYISSYPELFSAAMPISCGCDEPLDFEAMAKVPVWGFCGNLGDDGTHYLPAMERIARGINEAGGNAKIDILEGCGHAEAEKAAFTKEAFEWLLSQ